jgi:queuine tRNA-ribosyltransferase
MSFKLIFQSKISQARLGKLKTKRGILKTPLFMPIATRGAVKGITASELRELKAQIVLANTYHLLVNPGEEFLDKIGGLHKFMNWENPILTDSGGYQIFSLAKHREISDRGVNFRDPKSGTQFFLSPEKSIQMQKAIDSDIIIALDECTPKAVSKEKASKAVARTVKWARRCFQEHQKDKREQLLFAVGQGDKFLDLRQKCLTELKKINFDGYCYGGMAPLKTVYKMLEKIIPDYPQNKPRYLMGVGYPNDIVESVKRGIDMFDCVIPTREGRHGRIFLRKKGVELTETGFYETINLPQEKMKFSQDLFFPASDNCLACKEYTWAYVNYLFKIGDYLGPRLASLHNLAFYLNLMKEIREKIEKGKL